MQHLLILMMLCFALAGCGQKGELYLPGEEEASVSPTVELRHA